MEIKVTGSFKVLAKKLRAAPQRLGRLGEAFVQETTADMERTYRDRLGGQGRPGGEPPPLSEITRHLYSQLGEPDGTGVRNHIRTEVERVGITTTGTMGILEGKPSMIARIQDEGCIIPVTPKMRAFLAAYGVYLKASTQFIEIPARHAWSHSLSDVERRSRERLNLLSEQIWN